VNEKTCRKCRRALPLSMYWKCARYPGGLNTQCKDCLAPTPEQRERMRNAANKARRRNKPRHNETKYAYYKRHPEKRAAHNAVYYAIKRGDLERGPCEVCGSLKVQAHHDDYSRKTRRALAVPAASRRGGHGSPREHHHDPV
jgi:hypothetical protein